MAPVSGGIWILWEKLPPRVSRGVRETKALPDPESRTISCQSIPENLWFTQCYRPRWHVSERWLFCYGLSHHEFVQGQD
jgi:hypothetical protein